MVAVIVVAFVAAIAAIGAASALVTRRRSQSWIQQAERREVIVTTTNGDSFRGVLVAAARDGLVLEVARLVAADEQLAGQVWLPRPSIRWIQHP